MVELICLACGRTNQPDAKFCSDCGAALLRRFCEQCRAANDAAAHFCQACGAALSAQPVPATSTPLPGDRREDARARPPRRGLIPTLNPVVASAEMETATAAPPPQPWQGLAPGGVASASSGDSAPPTPQLARRTALLAVGGLVALLLAVALWSRAPRTDVRPTDPDTATARGAAPPDVPAAAPAPSVQPAPASTTATGSSESVEGRAAGTSGLDRAGEAVTEQAAPVPVDTPRAPAAAPSIGTEPPPPAAPPGVATTAPQPPAVSPGVGTGTRRPTATNRQPRAMATTPAPSPAPTPASECTRQLDALGLCPPGATITGR